MKGQQQRHVTEEVLVEDNKRKWEIEAEEEEMIEKAVECHPVIRQKRKASDTTEITLPYKPDVIVTVEDMLRKVSKLRYVDHVVKYAAKFPYLAHETYLEDKGEIGPLGKLVLEPTQWITGLYNSSIVNILDILHFGCGKNVGLCVKKIFSRVYGGIMWMDRLVPIDVSLISKITGFPTIGAQTWTIKHEKRKFQR